MTEKVYQGEDFEQKVRKQVEFYFSDSNLQTDKFLWRIYESNDGWVELKTILTFGRMRQYRPEDKVIEALKQSDKLVLSNNNDMIRRKDPLREFNELKNLRKRNSVHIEGFPKDLTQEDLEEYFNKKIVVHLPEEKQLCSIRRIRNRNTKEFFGVVDVEFKSQKDAEYFLEQMQITYPAGLVDGEETENKDTLKKMSLLTFQEMKENGKRFGINDVTKRKNSFNSNKDIKKFHKNNKKAKASRDDEEKESTDKTESEEAKEETKEEPKEEPKEAEEPKEENKD